MHSPVQSLSHVWLFATPWIAARQASLSITNSWSLLKLMSIESVMPSSHLILCHPLLLLPQVPPTIRVFSNESTLLMRWLKYWSFSFSISPSSEHPGLISFRRWPRGATLCPRSSICAGAGGLRGTTPHSRSGGTAVRRNSSSKVRSSGCALLEQPWGDTPRPRWEKPKLRQ